MNRVSGRSVGGFNATTLRSLHGMDIVTCKDMYLYLCRGHLPPAVRPCHANAGGTAIGPALHPKKKHY